jgi:2-polyprenyl-6-methoxyphenol hydroxylase-like FAD-dependent oxidoreductase
MVKAHAVVVGAGVGGLSAAAALVQRGWAVTVLERQPVVSGAGAGISLWPNALRALDRLGIGARFRTGGVIGGRSGVRRPDGRWIARSDLADEITRRFGRPLLLVHRAELITTLVDLLPVQALRPGVWATSIRQGESGPATVSTQDGELTADLVVLANGLRSPQRHDLFPGHPGYRYAGYTSWRMVTERPTGTLEPAETWGRRGERFAVLPLADDRVYCYATANAPANVHGPDERAELTRRFGEWHDPIPSILASVPPEAVLRTDIHELSQPLPAMHAGCVAVLGDAAHAMTPDLGQGGCQAIEDAVVLAAVVGSGNQPVRDALPAYTEARLGRTTDIVRRSRRAGRLYQAPPLLARAAAWGMNVIPASVIARGLAPILDWQPPE